MMVHFIVSYATHKPAPDTGWTVKYGHRLPTKFVDVPVDDPKRGAAACTPGYHPVRIISCGETPSDDPAVLNGVLGSRYFDQVTCEFCRHILVTGKAVETV